MLKTDKDGKAARTEASVSTVLRNTYIIVMKGCNDRRKYKQNRTEFKDFVSVQVISRKYRRETMSVLFRQREEEVMFTQLLLVLLVSGGETLAAEVTTAEKQGFTTTLQEQHAVVAHDIVFQQIGKLHPHESNLLIRTDLSYAALEAVPQKTEEIAKILKELADNLTESQEFEPVPEPVALPRYNILWNGTAMNVRQARLRCKRMGMRLVAPTDVAELKEAESYFVAHYPTTKWTQVWIDSEFDLQSAQLVNPINKQPLADIYRNVQASSEWKYMRDDYQGGLALIPVVGKLVSPKVDGLSPIVNSQQWYYVRAGTKEPEARVLCQGFNLDNEMVSRIGDINTARLLYSRENKRLPLQEIRETQRIFQVMAQDQRHRFCQLIERYDLQQPLFSDTPKSKRINPLIRQPLEITIAGPKRTFVVADPGNRKEAPQTQQPTGTEDRTKRDVAEQFLWNLGTSVPILGTYIGTVRDVLREKRYEAFRDATGQSIDHLFTSVTAQAREIKEIRFAEDEMYLQLMTMQNEMAWLSDMQSNVELYLEVNAVVDRLRTKALATHAEFLIQSEKFERWIGAMLKGQSPNDLYTGEVLKELRNVVAEHGLNVKAQFQDTESTILPHKNRTQSVIILSSVRTTSPAWTIYRQRSVPRFSANRLFREKLKTDYVAISPKYNTYVPLDARQVDKCKDKICQLTGPIRSLSHAECGTIALLGDPTKVKCPVEEIPYEEEFLELSDGGLIYSVTKPVQVTITCPYDKNQQLRHETVNGRGILFIKPGCRASMQNGVTFPSKPYTPYMAHLQRDITQVVADNTGLGRLEDGIELIINVQDTIHELSSRGPQIAIAVVVCLVTIGVITLACCLVRVRNRAIKLREWVLPWKATFSPNSVHAPGRNLPKKREPHWLRRLAERCAMCNWRVSGSAAKETDIEMVNRFREDACREECVRHNGQYQGGEPVDSILAVHGSPLTGNIGAMEQGNPADSPHGQLVTSSPVDTSHVTTTTPSNRPDRSDYVTPPEIPERLSLNATGATPKDSSSSDSRHTLTKAMIYPAKF